MASRMSCWRFRGRQCATSGSGARKARKDRPEAADRQYFRLLRQVIESVNDTLEGQLDLERHGGRIIDGATIRVLQCILALVAAIWHNNVTSQPVRHYVTDVIVEYFEQVKDDVVARIRQAGDPDVIHAIAGLAADVAAAAGGRRILLSLDNVEHLQADDRGRLMDLSPLLPAEVSVLGTFTSISGADESAPDQYTLASITLYPLLGLEAWAVRQWLSAEGLPVGMSEQVPRATNGYGIAVASAVQLLKASQSLTDATRSERPG